MDNFCLQSSFYHVLILLTIITLVHGKLEDGLEHNSGRFFIFCVTLAQTFFPFFFL